MRHADAREKLLDLAYGELPPREARRVERHAEDCAECHAELGRIRETRRLVSALPQEPAPERGERVLLAAAREAADRMRERRRAPLLPRWAWATSIGAAAILAVGGISYRLLALRPAQRDDAEALVGPARRETPPPPVATQEPVKEEPRAVADAPAAVRPAPRAPAERKAEAERVAAAKEAPADARAQRREIGVAGERAAGTPAPERGDDAPPARASAPSGDAGAPSAPAYSAAPPAAAPGAAAQPSAEAAPAAPSSSRSRAASREASSAPEDPIALYERLRRGGLLRSTERTFPGCAGEPLRRIDRDPEGRLVRLAAIGGSHGTIEQFYAPDGTLAAVRVERGGDRRVVRAPGGVLPSSLALAPGFTAVDAEAAEDAPPRCE